MKKFVIISYSDYDYNSCSVSEALDIKSKLFNTHNDALEHTITLAKEEVSLHEIAYYKSIVVSDDHNTVYVYDEEDTLVIAYVIKEIILEEEK